MWKPAKKQEFSLLERSTDNFSKLLDWLILLVFCLVLICGKVLVYQDWTRKQELKRLQARLKELQEKQQQQHQLQENYLTFTADLANNPQVHSFFSDLLRNYAKKFLSNLASSEYYIAKSKELPLYFEVFL